MSVSLLSIFSNYDLSRTYCRTLYTFEMNFNFNNLNFQSQQSPFSFFLNYFQYIQPSPPEFNSYNYQYVYPNVNFFEYEYQQNYISPVAEANNSPIEDSSQIKPTKKIKRQKKKIKKIKSSSLPTKNLLQLESKQLHYFDPNKAPLITSLRTKEQIQVQLLHFKLQESMRDESSIVKNEKNTQLQLQKSSKLILSEPNQYDYPFIIFKNPLTRQHKRRYSMQFFQKRADCILNRRQIPLQLKPKYIQKKTTEKLNMTKGVSGEIIDQLQEEYDDSLSLSKQVYQKQQQNYLLHQRYQEQLAVIQSLSEPRVKLQEPFDTKLDKV